MSQLDAVLKHIDGQQDKALERLFDLLKFESISTDSQYAGECVKAADWLVDDLASIGFDAKRHDTPGHPMVVAKHGVENNDAHVLFYGHYDVQPVDPLDLWNTAPFEPKLEDTPAGKVIRARGAADDKGQLMTFIEACRAWVAVTGSLPAGVTVFFEGEEESGSPSLIPFMEQNTDLLTADIALVCDTGMWDDNTPAISTMLRGMVGEQLTITGPSLDLHSGMFGGPAINPIRVLTKLLANLHDETGRITLDGFYDDVIDPPEHVRQQWKALQQDEAEFLGNVGLSTPAGEQGYSVLEQIWARPTFDVNGIWGGYTGEGFKTVLPSQASAKISFRLVAGQDPDKIQQTFQRYILDNLPPDCSVEFASKDASAATVMPVDAPVFANAQKALTEEWQNDAVYAGCGGSIPVVGHIKSILNMDSLLVGFGQDDDAIHSPNEKYNLKSFQKGTRSWARILATFAES